MMNEFFHSTIFAAVRTAPIHTMLPRLMNGRIDIKKDDAGDRINLPLGNHVANEVRELMKR